MRWWIQIFADAESFSPFFNTVFRHSPHPRRPWHLASGPLGYHPGVATHWIAVLEDGADPRARQLARALDLPLARDFDDNGVDTVLAFNGARLEVRFARAKPLWVDFLGAAMERRRGAGRRHHPLARAVGRKRPLPRVLDATAGLGRDSYVLASLGYEVVAVERCPLLHALLENGLARAVGSEAASRLRLVGGDARDYIAHLPENQLPDVVYVDPMFPTRTKAALVKKEMQFFQRLLARGSEDESDAESLFEVARSKARQRVVVKRPAKAPTLAGEPAYEVRGGRVRWDVYLVP